MTEQRYAELRGHEGSEPLTVSLPKTAVAPDSIMTRSPRLEILVWRRVGSEAEGDGAGAIRYELGADRGGLVVRCQRCRNDAPAVFAAAAVNHVVVGRWTYYCRECLEEWEQQQAAEQEEQKRKQVIAPPPALTAVLDGIVGEGGGSERVSLPRGARLPPFILLVTRRLQKLVFQPESSQPDQQYVIRYQLVEGKKPTRAEDLDQVRCSGCPRRESAVFGLWPHGLLCAACFSHAYPAEPAVAEGQVR